MHWIAVGGVAAALVIVGVVVGAGGDSPENRANKFFSALSRGDLDTLVDSSYSVRIPRDQLKPRWEQTIERSKYYRFRYIVKGTTTPTPTQANVKMEFERNYGAGSPIEYYDIGLVKEGGKWMVDIDGMSRSLYPYLPR